MAFPSFCVSLLVFLFNGLCERDLSAASEVDDVTASRVDDITALRDG